MAEGADFRNLLLAGDLEADPDAPGGLTFRFLHGNDILNCCRCRLLDQDVRPRLHGGDRHLRVQIDSCGDEAEIQLSPQGGKHCRMGVENPAADALQECAFLRLLALIDHGGAEEIDLPAFPPPQKIPVVRVSVTGDSDNRRIQHFLIPPYCLRSMVLLVMTVKGSSGPNSVMGNRRGPLFSRGFSSSI